MEKPLLSVLGLEDMGIGESIIRDILREVVEAIVSGYSSKPSAEAIIKRVKRSLPQVAEFVAGRLLSSVNKLSEPVLEYVVRYGGRALIPEMNRLYGLAFKLKREDLIGQLMYAWNKYGPRGLVECPRCGFRAIAPDNSCLVCNNVVTDSYIKKALNFDEKFSIYVKTASIAELREVLNYGYVLLSDSGIFYPKSSALRRGDVFYPIHLTSKEVSLIIEEINSRDQPF